MTTLAESLQWQPLGAAAPVPAAARPAYPPLTTAQKLLLPLGVLLFDWLFWEEKGGLNVLLFAVFVVATQLVLLPRHAAVRRSGYFWLAVGGSLFSGSMAAVYGSAAAELACAASLLMLLGYVNQPHLKLVLYALLTATGSVAQAGLRVLRGLRAPRQAGAGVRRSWFYGRLLLLPIGILAAFHLLFAIANPRYDALSSRMLAALGDWLARLLPAISLGHLLFVGLGFLAVAGVVVAVPVYFFADDESRFGEFIRRQRDQVASFGVRKPDFRLKTTRALDLRKELIVAVAVFGLVNALLLVVNIIDINWLWFGFVPAAGFDLAQFVHEGTFVLIFSILLAMGIVLWFFRRNLNFYAPGLPWLRGGATVWVLQNAVLATSVGLRNYYYILHSGLAYKRIGVCFFLLLTFFGLVTVLLKIWQRRSAYGLVRLNSLASYVVLLLLAAGNWEVWIAQYNLQPRFRSVDIGFLLNMPGRVLPTLLAHRAQFIPPTLLVCGNQDASGTSVENLLAYRAQLSQMPELVGEDEYGSTVAIAAADAQARLVAAITAWQKHYATHPDWQSRTLADWQTHQALQQAGATHSPLRVNQ